MYSKFGNKKFYKLLPALISYLRRQQKLIAAMRLKALKVGDTRWESINKFSEWF